MTDKELQKLSRSELLELLLVQSREMDRLNNEMEALQLQLQEREIALGEAGNIAEAALRLTGIFEAAQEAADLYLENIRTPNKMLEDTEAKCEILLNNTREKVNRVWEIVRQEIYNPRLDAEQWRKISDYIDRQLRLK